LVETGGARADRTARDVENQARLHLDQGLKLFSAGDFRGARDAYAKAHELVPERAQPFRLLGLTEGLLGECRAAIEHLDGFLARVPADDPRAEEARKARERCRAELAPPVGTIEIRSRPPGAEVRLDDESAAPVGVTPLARPEVAAGA